MDAIANYLADRLRAQVSSRFAGNRNSHCDRLTPPLGTASGTIRATTAPRQCSPFNFLKRASALAGLESTFARRAHRLANSGNHAATGV